MHADARGRGRISRALLLVDRMTAIVMMRTTVRIPVLRVRWRNALAHHPDVAVREYLARLPGSQDNCYYQKVLAQDSARTVRSTLARCRGYVSPSALAELAVGPDVSVRGSLAERSDLPEIVWHALVKDDSQAVRLRVARSDVVSPKALRVLCADPAAQVRNAVLTNPRTPSDGRVEVALRAHVE